MTPQHREFLNALQASGVTNMLGAVPYLMEEFDIPKREAIDILLEWFKTFND